MDYWFISLLGFIQGVTEFLPISSSAHLLVLANLLDFDNSFEIAVLLNIGSLIALIYWNRRLLAQLLAQIWVNDWQLAAKVLLSAVPAGLLGFFLTDFFKELVDQIPVMVVMLAGVGCLMLLKPPASKIKALSQLSWRQTWFIAGLQTLALIPGTSRSGITILGGLWLGLQQELAVRWSFLLAIPLIAGAIVRVLVTPEAQTFIVEQTELVLLGNLVAFGVSLLALAWLLQLVRRWSLKAFGYYRLALAALILAIWSWPLF